MGRWVQAWFENLNEILFFYFSLSFCEIYGLVERKDSELGLQSSRTLWDMFTNIKDPVSFWCYMLFVYCYSLLGGGTVCPIFNSLQSLHTVNHWWWSSLHIIFHCEWLCCIERKKFTPKKGPQVPQLIWQHFFALGAALLSLNSDFINSLFKFLRCLF